MTTKDRAAMRQAWDALAGIDAAVDTGGEAAAAKAALAERLRIEGRRSSIATRIAESGRLEEEARYIAGWIWTHAPFSGIEKDAAVAGYIAHEIEGYALRAVAAVSEDLEEEAEDLRSQITKLADFIVAEIPGEPSRSEGAVDTAIRLLQMMRKRFEDQIAERTADRAATPAPVTPATGSNAGLSLRELALLDAIEIAAADLERGDPPGDVLGALRSAARLFGLSPTELIKRGDLGKVVVLPAEHYAMLKAAPKVPNGDWKTAAENWEVALRVAEGRAERAKRAAARALDAIGREDRPMGVIFAPALDAARRALREVVDGTSSNAAETKPAPVDWTEREARADFALARERNDFAAKLRATDDALDRVGAPRGGDLSTPAERVDAFARRLPRARISGIILYGRSFLPPPDGELGVSGRDVALRVSDAGDDAIFLGVEDGACVGYVAADQVDRGKWKATVVDGRIVRLDHGDKSFFPPGDRPDAPPDAPEKPAWPAPLPTPIGTIAGGTPVYLHVDRRTVTEDARKAARPDRKEPWCWLCGLSLTGPTTYEVDGLPVHGGCFSGAEEGREKRMQIWPLEEAARFFCGLRP